MSAESKVYLICLTISSFLHISLIGVPKVFFNSVRQVRQPVEIVYLKKPPLSVVPPEKNAKPEKKERKVRENPVVAPAVAEGRSILDRKRPVPAYAERLRGPSVPLRPQMLKPRSGTGKKKITLPPAVLPPEGMGNPSYQGYYAGVREKIRKAAYDNYRQAAQGGVFVSFIVSRSGSLKAVRVMDERSTGNRYLREIASRSVMNAAPFSPFPKELDYDELTFNVMISFEIE